MDPTNAELPCPKCSRPLEAGAWEGEEHGTCLRCQQPFEFVGFPALTMERTVVKAAAASLEAGASCFFHDENAAVETCGHCGRFLCAVCAVDLGEGVTCPTCIAQKRKAAPEAVDSRLLYDHLAMTVAGLPLLFWPITLVTAPVALGLGIVGWRMPLSLTGGSRARLVIAMVLAAIEIVGWVVILGSLWFA